MNKTRFKTGDKVIVITGKDKGKKGSIEKIDHNAGKVVINGINLNKKHLKARGGVAGRIVEIPSAIHISNVAIIDPKENQASRFGKKLVGEKYVRISKKSNSEV